MVARITNHRVGAPAHEGADASGDQPTELPFEPLTVRIATAVKLTGIGRSKLYELIAEGEIETIKVGTMTLIPMRSLKEFLNCSEKPSSSGIQHKTAL